MKNYINLNNRLIQLKKIDGFFSTLNLPCLSDEQKTALDAPISKTEVLDAIKGLQSSKSPGPDGLCVEFYKEFQDLLVDPLLDMFNDALIKGSLPQSVREANISLILKKAKAPEDWTSNRSISLLNVDMKMFI